LLHWIAYTPEGTQAMFRRTGYMPGLKSAPVFKEIQADPVFKPYYDVLTTARYARINIPVASRYYDILAEEGDKAIQGKVSAKEAMDAAAQRGQQEWENFNREFGGK
jgi:ABC-type glycerol-3-phosphate transport system substrate-binding protein